MLGHFPNPQGVPAPSNHFQEANRDVLALARNFELSALEDRVGPPWEIWQFNEIIFFSSVLIHFFSGILHFSCDSSRCTMQMSAECTQNESEWKEGSAELLLILVSASIATHSLPGIALVGTQPDDSESVRSSFNLWEVPLKLGDWAAGNLQIWIHLRQWKIPAKVGIFKIAKRGHKNGKT